MSVKSRVCKCGKDMLLVDVHLRTVNALSSYMSNHGTHSMQLIKVFECGFCGESEEVCEEVE